MREQSLRCDRCGTRGRFREGGDMLPKGWAQLRITPSSTCSDEDLDLCGQCLGLVRERLDRDDTQRTYVRLALPVSIDFAECGQCAGRPGSPNLCAACLHNRTSIDRLRECLTSAVAIVGHIDPEDVPDSWRIALDPKWTKPGVD